MSDLENELLGLAEQEPRKKRSQKSNAYVDSSEDEGRPESEGEEEMDMDMEMDLESEEGEGDEAPARPAPIKRSSSTGKPKKAAKSKAATKSKAKAVKSSPKKNGSTEGVRNPYPLEGKYIDEDDRDRLEAMAEIDREEVLAERQEKMQKFKDAQRLDAMFQMAGGSSAPIKKAVAKIEDEGDDEEEDMDMDMDIDDDDDDDDEPSRKRRKHTSVTKETHRALNNLQKVRKRRHEDAERRAEKRAQAGASGAGGGGSSDEEGEIDDAYVGGDRDKYTFGYSRADSKRDRDGDYRGSAERSPDRRKRRDQSAGADEYDEEAELDKQPTSTMDLNAARVGRYDLVESMYKSGFEDVMIGAYVRLMAPEPDADGRPKYRIQRIHALQRRPHQRYPIEFKDRQIYEDYVVLCTYGLHKREYRVADISNGEFTNNEYGRFRQTSEADRVPIPKPSELKRIHEKLKALKERDMTNSEISAQVNARRAGLHPPSSSSGVLSRLPSDPSSFNSSPGRPGAGAVLASDQADARKARQAELDAMSEHDRRVAQINEIKAKRVRENMQKAHEAQMARMRLEEAMIKQKEAEERAAARAAEQEIQAIEKEAAAAVADEKDGKAMRKGETPQQYVARTVELDLGDF